MNANTQEKYDTKTKNFETLKYSISDNTDIHLDNSWDPDINFFNKKFQSFDTSYLMSGQSHNFPYNSSRQFSILHLNIRNFTFSVICLSERWWDGLVTIEKSLFDPPTYNSTHQAGGYRKGGRVSIFIFMYHWILQWNPI